MAIDLRDYEFFTGTKTPLVGATVRLRAASTTQPNAGAVIATTTTDVSGKWEFLSQADGLYDIEIEYNGRFRLRTGYSRFSNVLAVSQLTGLQATPPYNQIVNGGFEVWQRGAGPFSAHLAYSADRWQVILGGTSTLAISRFTAAAGPNGGQNYGAALTYTHGSANSAFRQHVNGNDLWPLRGYVCSASARVNCNAANAVRLQAFTTGATSNLSTTGAHHAGNGAWSTLTMANFLMPVDATGLVFGFLLEATASVFVDSVMLCLGPVAADFAPLPLADDLARCQRYYEVHGGASAEFPIVLGCPSNAGVQLGSPVTFVVQKGGTPTVTKNGTWAVTGCNQPTVSGANTHGYTLKAEATATTQVQTNPNGADDTITAEWNP
jgi:hypothetical protein